MKTYKTKGIVIKRRNSGEADRILSVYTQKNGKIQVKATGVRKITSRRASHIELLNSSFLTLYQGRSIATLIEVETVNDFSEIKQDLKKIGFAYHICELIDGLCPENQENESVFFLLENTLYLLSKEEDILTIIHEFEIELLILLGYWSSQYTSETYNTHSIIENILEKKLKAKQILPRLS